MRSILHVAAVYLALLAVTAQAATLGKECDSNSDCSDGATCVAGDAEQSVQRCVAGTVCGGSILGSCPGDEVSGQLACIWRQDAKTCSGGSTSCAEIGGELGIYKCISLDRCDEYFSGECSGKCSVNGKQCNGRGTCLLTGSSGSKPTFGCECNSGWNGTLCDNVVDGTCIEDVGQCGDHGTCVGKACSCKDGYSGDQCQIPPTTSLSSSGSSDDTGSNGSATKSPVPSPSNTTTTPNTEASRANNANDVISNKKSGGPSVLVIIIAVLVALIVVGAILFVVIARKRRREQEAADAGGFNRTDSVIAAEGGRPPTPKQKIVIM